MINNAKSSLFTIDQLLSDVFDELFPIMRSITGPGIDDSLEILSRFMPLEIEKVKSGTKVFDWEVPLEWHFSDAKLFDPNGNCIVDAKINNLSVVNYSEPINKKLRLEELQGHLHSIENLPHAIPYVTSYYKRNWGFCLPHHQRQALVEGEYHAVIESKFVNGGVPIAQCVLKGESSKEILLSSYLCHPSMANNELSGPLVLLGLYLKLKEWKRRRFTYRFVIHPETIGSLCFLYRHIDYLKNQLFSGMVLTCLGGPNQTLRFKQSHSGSSAIDLFMKRLERGERKNQSLPIETISFDATSGSDERQYNAPGFRLPFGQLTRTPPAQFEAYHNSLDTKEFMSISNLTETIDRVEEILSQFELATPYKNAKPFGEPQLGRYGLYPNMNSWAQRDQSSDALLDGRQFLNRVLRVLNESDGKTSMLEICEKFNYPLNEMKPIIEVLEQNKLLEFQP